MEVWYDETTATVAQEEFVVAEPITRVKVCRIETVCKLSYTEGHARRARIQNLVAPLRYEDETIEVTEEFIEQIRQAFHNLSDKQNVAVKFIGYSDNCAVDRPQRAHLRHALAACRTPERSESR